MGRKSRMKRERRAEVDGRRAVVREHLERRIDAARAAAVQEAEAADAGPHPLLPEPFHARRQALRAERADSAASFWTSMSLLVEMVSGESPPERRSDPEFDSLHDLDARVAWEQLLMVQDADPASLPDNVLCQVVADCQPMERGDHLDPLRGGMALASDELTERLNIFFSPDATAAECDHDLAQIEALMVARCGEPARSLLRYVASETTLHYAYPEDCWPEVPDPDEALAGDDDAVTAWVAADRPDPAQAVALAVRVAAVLAEQAELVQRRRLPMTG